MVFLLVLLLVFVWSFAFFGCCGVLMACVLCLVLVSCACVLCLCLVLVSCACVLCLCLVLLGRMFQTIGKQGGCRCTVCSRDIVREGVLYDGEGIAHLSSV